jgi:hypothetical protein
MNTPRVLLESEGKWVVAHTKAALPILIGYAKKQQPISYTDLNLEVAKKLGEKPNGNVGSYHMVLRHLANVLNGLSDHWSRDEIPPLSVLGIRQQDQLPGTIFDPFLSRYIAKINHGTVTKQNRASMIKLTTQKVYEYQHWDAVTTELGVEIL